MTQLNNNGVSVCANGEERYGRFTPAHRKGKQFIQYDYRHTNGELFSTVAPTLAQMGCSLLWNLFRNGMTDTRGFFLNLKDFRTQPLKVG